MVYYARVIFFPVDKIGDTFGEYDRVKNEHYSDVIKSAMASQITVVSIVYWTGWSGTDQSK